jgi:phosphomannomutase
MSVSGIRGIVGDTLTPSVATEAGCAFGTFVDGAPVVVGRDSRVSGDMVRSAVVSGLLACGCDVIDIGIGTTPTTALMAAHRQAAGGIMITASHNPMPWNGIKFFSADAVAPPKPVVDQILALFHSRDFKLVPADATGRVSRDDSSIPLHVETVLQTVDADAIRRQRFKVVLDSVNGGGGPAGRALLEALGCDVVQVNGEPTGRFAHTPEPIAENLTDLSEHTRKAGADIGFAQDPDADRLAVVDENGRYVGEEYTLVIAAKEVFATRPGPACANLSTSRMIDDVAAEFAGCTVHRAAVGEANVAEVMKAHDCVVGGEGNGGVIDPRVVHVRDSLVAMALVLQRMTSESRPISQIVDAVPRYASIKQKFECSPERVAAVLSAVQDAFRGERVSDLDGIRIDWPNGWVHIRGSNTEPIMRVVCEAADENTGEALVARVRQVVDDVPA